MSKDYRPDFKRCANHGCGRWVEWHKKYCSQCFKLFYGTHEETGFYDPEYAKGDGDLKVYEGE